ncbi:hypothetical protein ACSLBF_05595 [Pseudoalteromonas sp. T1lg65]|uniref:hypothetical protein n=1 Tax=Pseudoalteromonas sp. T1lg65 TaxID=2077101 RepID=UPI003F7A6D2A
MDSSYETLAEFCAEIQKLAEEGKTEEATKKAEAVSNRIRTVLEQLDSVEEKREFITSTSALIDDLSQFLTAERNTTKNQLLGMQKNQSSIKKYNQFK